MNLNGTQAVTSNMIYRLVKRVFMDCAGSIAKIRPDFAMKLRKASTHWLRHTSITHQVDAGIELRYIKLNARHDSVEKICFINMQKRTSGIQQLISIASLKNNYLKGTYNGYYP